MPKPRRWSETDKADILRRFETESAREIAESYGVSAASINNLLHWMRHGPGARSRPKAEPGPSINARPVVTNRPTANRPLDELLAAMAEGHVRKRAHHSSRVEVRIPGDQPFGLLGFGDPHLGDPGCDIEYLAWCLELCRTTEGLYGLNIGDLSNNWCGKLGRLYAHQETTDDDERALVRWLLGYIPWLFVILGNHDKWSPVASLLCEQAGVAAVSHGGMFEVRNDVGTILIDARHDHAGRSQFRPDHGQARRSYRGSPADIIVGGHTHQGAGGWMRNGVTRKLAHVARLGAFKRYDDYADAKSFDSDDTGPVCLWVCDPRAECDEDRVVPFLSLRAGVRYLEVVRRAVNE